MKIGVLGTGMVGKTIGSKLVQLGHEVKMGSRSSGSEKSAEWIKSAGVGASQGTFAEAASFSDLLLFNCTSGMASMAALKEAGSQNMEGKILIDLANPLDFSKGMPPTLSVCNTDSLGEQIQREYPGTKVVKTLNTVNANLMVNPGKLPGNHTLFLSGNDETSKGKVRELLMNWFGWKSVCDLGDISSARGTEMMLPLWIRMMGAMGTPNFNFQIVKEESAS